MKIFPVPNDSNNKWVSQQEVSQIKFQGVDSLYVNNVLPLYFASMRQGKLNGDYIQADGLLESLKGYQNKYGASIIPSKKKIDAEIIYNKYNICLLYTSPSPRDSVVSRMPSSA